MELRQISTPGSTLIRLLALLAGLWIGCLASSLALAALDVPQPPPDLVRLATPVRDFTSTVTATEIHVPELVKISKSYAKTYQASKTSRVTYLAPQHLKVDSSLGSLAVRYVVDGNTLRVKYGPLRQKVGLSNAPGRKEGLLDFGILTPDQLDDYTWTFVREERAGDAPFEVFELRFKNYEKDTSRFLIWVDPARRLVARRQVYYQLPGGGLKMDIRYESPLQADGVWVPTTIKVYNAEGKLGVVSRQSTIRVNTGVALSAFKL